MNGHLDSISPVPASQPEISVRLYTEGAPLLVPLGEFDIRRDDSGTVLYTPCNPLSTMLLENLRIGIGFHWHRTLTARFQGSFRVYRDGEGWATVNILPLEQYLQSVISSEMNADAPMEFLKAHAVISRSWALRRISHDNPDRPPLSQCGPDTSVSWENTAGHIGFDVCGDDHCQRYQGLRSEGSPRAVEAVAATRGTVLTDSDGRLADTRFSKCCGGHTELFSTCWEDHDPYYLVGRPDPHCDLSAIDPESRDLILMKAFKDYDRSAAAFTEWTHTVDAVWLRSRVIDIFGRDPGEVLDLIPLRSGPSGRISMLKIVGKKHSMTIGKELAIRRMLHPDCLKSSAFTVSRSGSAFILRGKGWGHGVGLCQTGAAVMASQGASFEDILQFYYPGTRLYAIY